MPKTVKWFHNWFNSPYYHILYKQRDDEEAEHFIDNLCSILTPSKDVKMLDIACGRGRHAIYLNKKGYEVTGIDLSEENIQHASIFNSERLRFYVHDMRNEFNSNHFDIAFNLFTSFGYFETKSEDLQAISAFANSLKSGGILVLDFMNAEFISKNLVVRESKICDHIKFNISRHIENGVIIKEIIFKDKDKDFAFKEEVRALSRNDFEGYFNKCGFKVVNLFGDYELSAFNPLTSDRMIFVCRKD